MVLQSPLIFRNCVVSWLLDKYRGVVSVIFHSFELMFFLLLDELPTKDREFNLLCYLTLKQDRGNWFICSTTALIQSKHKTVAKFGSGLSIPFFWHEFTNTSDNKWLFWKQMFFFFLDWWEKWLQKDNHSSDPTDWSYTIINESYPK